LALAARVERASLAWHPRGEIARPLFGGKEGGLVQAGPSVRACEIAPRRVSATGRPCSIRSGGVPKRYAPLLKLNAAPARRPVRNQPPLQRLKLPARQAATSASQRAMAAACCD